jgi:hypothetical protein
MTTYNGYTESSAKIAYRWEQMKARAQKVAVTVKQTTGKQEVKKAG